MKIANRYREAIADVRRVVVKIGSRVLVQKTGRPDVRRMRMLTKEIALIQKSGREVVVVTSGAVAAGMEALGMKQRPAQLPDLQMAAAVGQTRLMSKYDELFGAAGCKIGQLLLTHGDFLQKVRLTNVRRTMENLLRNGVIPMVNENDVVADEEIKAGLSFGDNDYLASLVVKMVRADLLVLLTTVDGLQEKSANGRMKRVPYLEKITRKTMSLVSDHESDISKGGMGTKLKAARAASRAGCTVVIGNGRESKMLTRIIEGKDVGTMILASGV